MNNHRHSHRHSQLSDRLKVLLWLVASLLLWTVIALLGAYIFW